VTLSGWTVETLKELVDQRFAHVDQRIVDARHSVERAEDAATATRVYTETKNNEFRGQLADQASSFMPRAEADQRYSTTVEALSDVRTSSQRLFEDHRVASQKTLDEIRDQHRRSIDELRGTTQKATDELRRLVYIATGVALAAGVAIPLLLRS